MTMATPDPESITARLLGRHCAGIAERPAPRAILAYLGADDQQQPPRPADFTVRSLLNCIEVPELLELLVDCSIAPTVLAAHMQRLGVTNQPALACLNQICLPDTLDAIEPAHSGP